MIIQQSTPEYLDYIISQQVITSSVSLASNGNTDRDKQFCPYYARVTLCCLIHGTQTDKLNHGADGVGRPVGGATDEILLYKQKQEQYSVQKRVTSWQLELL